MPYNINHIHLKSEDPKSTADWFVKAFNVEIISDTVRHFGDRFIVTKSENDITINMIETNLSVDGVDTPQDLILVREIFNSLVKTKKPIQLKKIIKFLDKNPKLLEINSSMSNIKKGSS